MTSKQLLEHIVAEIESNLQYGIGDNGEVKFNTYSRDAQSIPDGIQITAHCVSDECVGGRFFIRVTDMTDARI